MKKRIFILCLALVIAVTLFAACSHTHTFDEDWSYNDTHHWHDANCGHNEIQNKEAHSFLPVPGSGDMQCEVCGFVKVSHKHEFSEKWSFDNDTHWHEAVCAHKGVTSNKAPHFYKNGVCVVCGAWESVTQALLNAFAELNTLDYTFTLRNVKVGEANNYVFIDYLLLECGLNADKELVARGKFDCGKVVSVSSGGSEISQQNVYNGMFIVENGEVYAQISIDDVNNELHFRLEDLLEYTEIEDADVDLETLKDAITEIENSKSAIQKACAEIAEITPLFKGFARELFNSLFVADSETDADGEDVYILDFDVLRQLNNTLATKKVSDCVDGIFGKGTFENLPQIIEGIFKLKVGDIIAIAEKQGYDQNDLIALIDGLVAEYYPDPEIKTLEELLRANNVLDPAMTLDDAIAMIKPMTLGAIWNLAQGSGSGTVTWKEVVSMAEQYCSLLKDKSFYGAFAIIYGNGVTEENIKTTADIAIDALENYLRVEVRMKNGVVSEVSVKAEFPENCDSFAPSEGAYEIAAFNAVKQILSSFEGEISLIKDYETGYNFREVKDSVIGKLNAVKADDAAVRSEAVQSVLDSCYLFGGSAQASAKDNCIVIDYKTTDSKNFSKGNGLLSVVWEINAQTVIDFNTVPVLITDLCGDKYSLNVAAKSFGTAKVKAYWTAGSGDCELIELTEKEFYDALAQYGKSYAEACKKEIESYVYADTVNVEFFYDPEARVFCAAEDCECDFRFSQDESVIVEGCGMRSAYVYRCSVCNGKKTEYVFNNHDFENSSEHKIAVGGVCDKGVELYRLCNLCGQFVKDPEYFECGHDLEDVEVNLNACGSACRDHAIRLQVCKTCSKVVSFAFVNGEKADQSLYSEDGLLEVWKCKHGDCSLTVKEYALPAQESGSGYEITSFKVGFEFGVLYDGRSVRYDASASEHRHDYAEFLYGVKDNGTCVNGVEITAVCAQCGNDFEMGEYSFHPSEKIPVELPENVCANHRCTAYVCSACNLGVGFGFDQYMEYSEEQSGSKSVVYVCPHCDLVVKNVLVEEHAEEGYDLMKTQVCVGDDTVYEHYCHSYYGGNSYPAKSCAAHKTAHFQSDCDLNGCSQQDHVYTEEYCELCGIRTNFTIGGIWDSEDAEESEYGIGVVVKTLTCRACGITVYYTVTEMPKDADYLVVNVDVVDNNKLIYFCTAYFYYETHGTFKNNG